MKKQTLAVVAAGALAFAGSFPAPFLASTSPLSPVQSTAARRFNTLLMSVFGCCALLLAATGIYGLMAYSVEQRTQEIGIRLALGAGAARMKQRVVMQGLMLAFAGVAIGVTAALGLTKFIASSLYGVQARDPFVFLLVPVLLAAVALFAIWFFASLASRIDPIETLRHE